MTRDFALGCIGLATALAVAALFAVLLPLADTGL